MNYHKEIRDWVVLISFQLAVIMLILALNGCSSPTAPPAPPETITSYPGAPAPVPTPREGA
jgi:hypothetical protein